MLPIAHKSVAINTQEALAEVITSIMGAMVKARIIAIKIDLRKLTVDLEVKMAIKTKSYI